MLYLLRHGSTILNEKGIAQSKADIGLSAEGNRQVILAVERIKLWRSNLTNILSSATKRTLETASILHRYFPNSIVRNEECLRERWLGSFEGLNREDLLAARVRYGIEGTNIWQDWDGCTDVESDHSIFQRVSHLLTTPESHTPFVEKDVIWITHSGVIKSFIRFACGSDGGHTRIYVACGGIVRVWQDKKTGEMTIDQIYNPDNQ